MTDVKDTQNKLDNSGYKVIKDRLVKQGNELSVSMTALNKTRQEAFGSVKREVTSRIQIETDLNCTLRDAIQINDLLMVGHNAHSSMKSEVRISDIFSLYRVSNNQGGHHVARLPLDGTFLDNPSFKKDFAELYSYFKDAKLVHITESNQKLLVVYQIGMKVTDVKVFRWQVGRDGELNYLDNRGDKDYILAKQFSFSYRELTPADIDRQSGHIELSDRVFARVGENGLNIIFDDGSASGATMISEPVKDAKQALEDVDVFVAKVDNMLLAKIKPYREEVTRNYIINTVTHTAHRCDGISTSCQTLPDGHGVIFPGGVYLSTDELKIFNTDIDGWQFEELLASPNGEDMLYTFYHPESGEFNLIGYNMVERTVDTPINGHGYALFKDGSMVVFRADDDAVESTIHPMQIWRTSFYDDRHTVDTLDSNHPLASLGNNEIVRALADTSALINNINQQTATRDLYQNIMRSGQRILDTYYWINDKEFTGVADHIRNVIQSAESVIGEFDKVVALQRQATDRLNEATKTTKGFIAKLRTERWDDIEKSMPLIHSIREQKGNLISLRELNYMDVKAVDFLLEDLNAMETEAGEALLVSISDPSAFTVYRDRISEISEGIDEAAIDTLKEKAETIDVVANDLNTITEIMNNINAKNPTVITQILDIVSNIYADINQVKAIVKLKLDTELEKALSAQYNSQMTVLAQRVNQSINMVTTVDDCNEQFSGLTAQLEEMESRFGQVESFAEAILAKRDEITSLFEDKKQSIANAIQKEIKSTHSNALKLLDNIGKKAGRLDNLDALNGFFSSDPIVIRVNGQIKKLEANGGVVQADDIAARLKGMKDQTVSVLKDQMDLIEDGGRLVRFGKHRFTINQEALDLSIVTAEEGLSFHLTGTDFYENITDDRFNALSDYWSQDLISESKVVSRAEYLAYQFIKQAQGDAYHFITDRICNETLDEEVRELASKRFKDGYEKGLHDHDAVIILKAWAKAMSTAESFEYAPKDKAVGYKNALDSGLSASDYQVEYDLMKTLNVSEPFDAKVASLAELFNCSTKAAEFTIQLILKNEDFAKDDAGYQVTQDALNAYNDAYESFDEVQINRLNTFVNNVDSAESMMTMGRAIFNVFVEDGPAKEYIVDEAVICWLANATEANSLNVKEFSHVVSVRGLMSSHPTIKGGEMNFSLLAFNERLAFHEDVVVPGFNEFNDVRSVIAAEMKDSLKISEFMPKPLTSFVRNKLVNEVYLPIIGDNLAKQMGAADDSRRSDLMGMLLLISPPGYGKTTLVEYVAAKLGMVFMKINCPSIGHEITSIDPSEATNAATKNELQKINLAFEMGNNVLLYLDDIQHTNPEFLQKYISLCDGTRRIEGVWNGKSRTYDMRGRKFAIIMAGNPYTESGETFKIPDMLANRADVYNMGDMMAGQEAFFGSSYVENCLTSNATLAPLASRGMHDVYVMMDLAANKPGVSSSDLEYQYSGAEIDEMVSVLKNLFTIRETVMKVNAMYIASASQKDSYRTEPPFKLQGSYRNMNKLAEKTMPVMNETEVLNLVLDHYRGESQTLTTGAEENLLKLREMMGILTEEETARWNDIKAEFVRGIRMGDDDDGLGKIANQISYLSQAVSQLTEGHNKPKEAQRAPIKVEGMKELLEALTNSKDVMTNLVVAQSKATKATTIGEIPTAGGSSVEVAALASNMAEIIEALLIPIMASMEHKFRQDQSVWEGNIQIKHKLSEIQQKLTELVDKAEIA